jgi:hypothetical protein
MSLKDIVDFLTEIHITALVNVVSLIGFVLTIIVFLNVKRIVKYYVLLGRSPDLTSKIKKHSSNLSNYFNDFDNNRYSIHQELSLSEVTLKSLERKADGQVKKSVKDLGTKIRNFDWKNGSADDAREIHVGMLKLLEEFQDMRQDQEWERRP